LEDEDILIAMIYAVKHLRHSNLQPKYKMNSSCRASRKAEAARSTEREMRAGAAGEYLAPMPLKALTIAVD
jgi:hypothetical protein